MSAAANWPPGHLPKGELPAIDDGVTLVELLGDVAELVDHLSAAAARFGAPDRPDLFGALVEWQDSVRAWIVADAAMREAERTVRLAEYRQLVEAALARLTDRPGLSWTRLDRGYSSTYLVACDNRELGTARPAVTRYGGDGRIRRRTWRATPTGDPLANLGPFGSLRKTAEALARHAGLPVTAPQPASGG